MPHRMRPNIILLVGEDTGVHHRCYGDEYAVTPNIDRLAAGGCRYTNAFSTAPVSAPARAAIVTGRYAWSIGAHHMRSTLTAAPPTFTQALREAGYHVRWPGKTDFNFEPPSGFADSDRDWLDDLRDGMLPSGGFFLYRNLGITHESTMWSEPIDGEGMVRRRLERLDELTDAERHRPEDAPVPTYLPDTAAVREDIARYHDALTLQDRDVGAVMDALESSPCADETIIIYLSDHGRGLPREKRWCYDAGVHVPLIVSGRPLPLGARVDDRLVSGVDIAPTILALAGASHRADTDGIPFLTGSGAPSDATRAAAVSGRDRMDEAFDRVRTARDTRYRYIRNYFPQLPYAQRISYMERQQSMAELRRLHAAGRLTDAQAQWMCEAKRPEELYDSTTDPQMVENRIDDPALASVRDRLREALDDELDRSGDLGELPERELIRRGLVVDRLAEYRERIAPLSEEYQLGTFSETVLEMPDARESDDLR